MATQKTLTLAEKLAIAKSFEEAPSQSQKETAEKYGVGIAKISRILKNRQFLKSTIEKVPNLSWKRQRSSAAPDVDETLFTWFRRASTVQGIPISGDVLKEKVFFFARSLNVENFNASDGWLGRWKNRFNVILRKAQSEKRDADTRTTETWLEETLSNILRRYNESDIFNADETGLYYRLCSDWSHISKGETLAGSKKNKARVTILVGANIAGTEKLPLLMIGKSRKPRCFRGCQTLPCTYDSNAIAWMTRKIFEAWIKKCDNKLWKAKRRVVFIVDNCTAHPIDITLTNTELVFLPPNVTSLIQPCDQGIIKTLKAHYHKDIIKRLAAAIDAGSSENAIEFSRKFDLLDAIIRLLHPGLK